MGRLPAYAVPVEFAKRVCDGITQTRVAWKYFSQEKITNWRAALDKE